MVNKEQKKDIFDRLMHLKAFSFIEPFYLKNKEILLYLFFGGLTFIVGVGTFALFDTVFGLNELIANIISWVLAVLFAYITNRTWVFQNKAYGFKGVLKESLLFFAGRLVTLAVEEAILYIFITRLGFNSIIVKIVAQIIVIVLNYVFSKLLVFRNKKNKEN